MSAVGWARRGPKVMTWLLVEYLDDPLPLQTAPRFLQAPLGDSTRRFLWFRCLSVTYGEAADTSESGSGSKTTERTSALQS